MAKTLTLGKGKSKRQWKLSESEFKRFESMFEENELIDMSDYDFSGFTLTEVAIPSGGIELG